ncbi:MAG: hypothetical protein H6832_17895 [Planctomycetes bacterium]|nr:hypothetical protein [Planctomycetota bacterium]MCB9920279.1 hypothetical protein [Planctomycetota bacterium]
MSRSRDRYVPLLLVLLASAMRLALAFRVRVPSSDGAIYLWACEAIADGRFADGWSTVFHPGTAMLVAPLVGFGVSSDVAFALVATIAAGFVVIGIDRICRSFECDATARTVAMMLFVVGFHFVRLPADVYSEAFALPFVTWAIVMALRERWSMSAALAGCGFFVRPEAILVAVVPWMLSLARDSGRRTEHAKAGGEGRGTSTRRRNPARAIVGICVVCALSFGLLRGWLTGGHALTPKLDFMLPLGPLGPLFEGHFAEAASRLGSNVFRLVPSIASGLDYGSGFLGLIGLVLLAKSTRARAVVARAMTTFALLHVITLLAFETKPRFFLMLAPILLPCVGVLWMRLRGFMRQIVRVAILTTLVVAVVRDVKDQIDPPRSEKRVELELGRQLAARGSTLGNMVSALPRVAWAAGQRPLPPWPWTATELLQRVIEPHHRILVMLATDDNLRAMIADPRGFRRVDTPGHATERGARIAVYER